MRRLELVVPRRRLPRASTAILRGFLGRDQRAHGADRGPHRPAGRHRGRGARRSIPTAFASLTAADFSANDQLARMLGETEFGALFHQGERESMYLADVARRVILVVLFDNRTTLGLVKLRVKPAVGQLNQVFTDMFERDGTSAPGVESAFLGEAEDEIDKLFGA